MIDLGCPQVAWKLPQKEGSLLIAAPFRRKQAKRNGARMGTSLGSSLLAIQPQTLCVSCA